MRLSLRSVLCATLVLTLAGCGGGTISSKTQGGGAASSNDPGSGGTTSGGGTPTGAVNVAPLVVDSGPAGASGRDVDVPFTTITLCDSSTPANCQTIDHILVDTGSTGLRILASVLSPALQLQNDTDATGKAYGECMMFVSGYVWGPVKLASMTIAGETTTPMPVQIIADPGFAGVPTACSNAGSGLAMDSVAAFGANGLIGVGNFKQDCGKGCEVNTSNGIYYACSGSSCSATSVSRSQQVPNPVSLFAADNNGVIVSLPTIPASGQVSARGSLIFGIDTRDNNQLNGATILALEPNTGFLPTVFNGATLCDSFIDSGSNGLYFPASGNLATSLPFCSGSEFYCPTATQDLSAVIKGIGSGQVSVNFSVANTNKLDSKYSAFNDLAGGNSYGGFSYPGCTGTNQGFDWGLPFFFGRDVFVVIEGELVGGSTGPYDAI